MVASRVGCMDVMLLYFAGGKPKTEEGKRLFEGHQERCSCVRDILTQTGDLKEPLPLFSRDKAVLLEDFGPCDFPEQKEEPFKADLLTAVLVILSKRGKV